MVVVAGAASALLVLARVDFAPLLLVVAIAAALRWRSLRRLGWWTAGCAALAVPAMLWWLLSWGHLLSTSATVKNAMLGRLYADGFGGRLTAGYADYLVDVTRHYVSQLDVWSALGRRSTLATELGLSGAARLGALVVLVVALAGWAVAGRKRLGERESRGQFAALSAPAWAIVVTLVVVVVKGAMDIVTAPLWADKWYAAPQQLAVGFIFGAGAWMGVQAMASRGRWPALAAVVPIVILAIPVNTIAWAEVSQDHHERALWQDRSDLAAAWIATDGPPGLYGAADAGLLGYRLDGTVQVVNLDGLVNDYEFARLAADNAPLLARVRATDTDFFVGRIATADLRKQLPCGGVLWSSPGRVPYNDSLNGLSRASVKVIDVRDCR